MKRDKRLGIILSIYIFCVLELALFIPLGIKGVISAHSKTTKLKNSLSQFIKDKGNINNYLLSKEKKRKRILSIKSKIISSQDISEFQAYISDRAKDNHIEIEEIGPYHSKEAEKPVDICGAKFSYQPVKMKLISNYHTLAKFFNDLEKGRYFLTVKEFSIVSGIPYDKVNAEVWAIEKE